MELTVTPYDFTHLFVYVDEKHKGQLRNIFELIKSKGLIVKCFMNEMKSEISVKLCYPDGEVIGDEDEEVSFSITGLVLNGSQFTERALDDENISVRSLWIRQFPDKLKDGTPIKKIGLSNFIIGIMIGFLKFLKDNGLLSAGLTNDSHIGLYADSSEGFWTIKHQLTEGPEPYDISTTIERLTKNVLNTSFDTVFVFGSPELRVERQTTTTSAPTVVVSKVKPTKITPTGLVSKVTTTKVTPKGKRGGSRKTKIQYTHKYKRRPSRRNKSYKVRRT